MTEETIPAICRECPQSRQNFYTKSWYCVNSGAPLGSKRAWDYCTSPRRAEALASKAGSSVGQTSAPEAGKAAGPSIGQTSEAGNSTKSAPEASQETADADYVPHNQEAADGDVLPEEMVGTTSRDEDFVNGYPFDFLFAPPR